MNVIYLHGFKSSALSIKGQLLEKYCSNNPNINVHLPDLNQSPLHVIDQLSSLIESMNDVALVGSSLGGFYATHLVAKHHVPAVLINPAMRPWQLFRELFDEVLPYQVHPNWCLDDSDLDQLEQLALPTAQDADKILVLLQQGDEVLDYREAHRYYSDARPPAMMMTEAHGNHGMDDFAEKIPLVLQFLLDCIKKETE
ncbi:alpha/beta fold hydrolase [Acinetobacter wanghuae]|uniref:Alpha/beta fold hydrolase n=1 Tax=Acinetobacter wanghuae TaxID=2662362 RepID=A0A5Q0P0B2_9GAMM|nr:YqiA/YcfP family alpha/beta fold hydrolase [Acinetobacter wanghuae]MQW91850.1 alpha/beta fold hydrolase [Acinetobacter wanghuae]QGA09953.1 alpha/beta fold hydrolase [Acinetobacter wanghuae]